MEFPDTILPAFLGRSPPILRLESTQLTDAHAVLTHSDIHFNTSFPTNIHLDLQRAGRIPDPQLGLNERSVQWVHDATWRYFASLAVGAPQHSRVCLVFEGLDTFATVRLDGAVILESQNMFLSHRVDVTDIVHAKQHLILTIDFESALKRGDEIMANSGGERATWNGHLSRVFVRKAQYHYVFLSLSLPLLRKENQKVTLL